MVLAVMFFVDFSYVLELTTDRRRQRRTSLFHTLANHFAPIMLDGIDH